MIHVMTIHGWVPARINQILGNRRKGSALKRRDRYRIANEQRFRPIPEATGRRRVTIEITWARGDRPGDPDAYQKSVHDALKKAKLIKDDTIAWVQLTEPVYLPLNPRDRTDKRMTRIILEDVKPLRRVKIIDAAEIEFDRIVSTATPEQAARLGSLLTEWAENNHHAKEV